MAVWFERFTKKRQSTFWSFLLCKTFKQSARANHSSVTLSDRSAIVKQVQLRLSFSKAQRIVPSIPFFFPS